MKQDRKERNKTEKNEETKQKKDVPSFYKRWTETLNHVDGVYYMVFDLLISLF